MVLGLGERNHSFGGIMEGILSQKVFFLNSFDFQAALRTGVHIS
jgi:hypothetical protein